jgi:hypothetical protein
MERKLTRGLKNTLLLHAIAMVVFASVYLFVPMLWGELTGCLSNKVPHVFRLFGTAILGFGIGSYLAFRETTWEAVKVVVQMECILNVLFPIIILLGLIFWELPSIAWMYFVVMSGFGVAFNYFYVEVSRSD